MAFTEHPHERVRVQDPDQPAEIASLRVCVRLARPRVRNALGELVASKPTFIALDEGYGVTRTEMTPTF
jgi:hypothetical protein